MRTIVGRGYVGVCFKDEISWTIFVYMQISIKIFTIPFFIRKGRERRRERKNWPWMFKCELKSLPL